MLHIVYLSGLCQRRQWPDPYYEVTPTRHGYSCVVRVNNREYQTSKYFPSEVTARESAATIAFNICRSFSVNDGMYPTGFAHDNVIQGRAVPVGAGRTSRRPPPSAVASAGTGRDNRRSRGPSIATPDYRMRAESISSSSRSGGSSPDISDDSSTSLYGRHASRPSNPYQAARYAPNRHSGYPLGSR